MRLEYRNANDLLIDSFPEMKEIYNNDIDEYVDLPYAFYESEFVPFIMNKMRQNSQPDLIKIFNFIEKIFREGDEMIVNLAGVAIVESLYNEESFTEFNKDLSKFYGELTQKSFEDCAVD